MRYDDVIAGMNALTDPDLDPVGNLANLAAYLYDTVPDLNWVGFYVLRGEVLHLWPFAGRPACTRIPLGKGVCGTAAARNETLVVPDVHLFPGHIACDERSASEIVIPLRDPSGSPVGVLDVDSPVPGRFGRDEEALFAAAAEAAGSILSARGPAPEAAPVRPERLLAFLRQAAALKDTPRHCRTIRGEPEFVAGHCWRIALMAQLLTSSCPEIDMNRVIRICLVHDLGEAVTGDIPTFLKTGADEDTEDRAVAYLLSLLDPPVREEIAELFAEMNAMQTPEAKFWKALDKIEAVISHNESDLSTWIPREREMNLTYGISEAAFHPVLAAIREAVREETAQKLAGEQPASDPA